MHNIQHMVLDGCVSVIGHVKLPYEAQNLAGCRHCVDDETNALGEHCHRAIRVRTISNDPR